MAIFFWNTIHQLRPPQRVPPLLSHLDQLGIPILQFDHVEKLRYTTLKVEELPMSVSHISEKGHILIPRQLRRKLGFKPGGKVQLIEEGGRLVVAPAADDPIAAATGFLTGKFSLTTDLQREHREEARRERKARSR
jgi:AbrB family looped-hinge helix DNA binding protein